MTPSPSQNWKILFFVSDSGRSPVFEDIDRLQPEDQANIRNHLRLLEEFGVSLGMPHAKPVKGYKPLWELRPSPYRVLYFAHTGRRFFILHVCEKKRWKIAKRDLKTAMIRMKIIQEREK